MRICRNLCVLLNPDRHLKLPGMTTIFTDRAQSLLDTMRAGDKAIFALINDSAIVVLSDIQAGQQDGVIPKRDGIKRPAKFWERQGSVSK